MRFSVVKAMTAPVPVAALAALAAIAALAGVAAPAAASGPQPGPPPFAQPSGFNPHNLPMRAGLYRCELNRVVDIRQVTSDLSSAVVRWNKREYTLRAVNAESGALRYEDERSGLVWIVIAGKSMLLDARRGKQLANECRA
jgi:hypothetical protein